MESDSQYSDSAAHSNHRLPLPSICTVSTPSPFSHLYCGIVCLIESFLSFTELTRFACVSHYHRGVAMGVHNPIGMYREGKEKPYVTWDILSSSLDFNSQFAVKGIHNAAETRSSLTPRDDHRIPDFLHIAEANLESKLQENSQLSFSAKDLETFLAVIPAPPFGSPRRARQYCFNYGRTSIDSFLLSPILDRHLQELHFPTGTFDESLSLSSLTLISLRFPFLRSLTFTVWTTNTPLSFGGMKFGLRLPLQLRTLHINCPYRQSENHYGAVVLSVLPNECPMLEELQLGKYIPVSTDLSPLVQLPHLTRLSLLMFKDEQHVTFTNQKSVLHRLQLLRYLRIEDINENTPLDAFLPQGINTLEEFPLPVLTDSMFLLLVQRTPLLHTIASGDGGPCDFHVRNLVDPKVLSQFQSLHTLKFGLKLLDRRGLSSLGVQCVRNGSLNEHLEQVLAALGELRGLTNLHLGHLYTALSCRSLTLNCSYFASRDMTVLKSSEEWILLYEVGDPIGPESNRWYPRSAHAPVHLYHNSETLFPYDRYDFKYMLHPVFQLAAHLPLLVSLTLSHSSALHLPSLSFLQHLPKLQSFSLQGAHFLPPESLHDLCLVSSTLTRLEIIDSFPVDLSGRAVYLMHDILQPLNFSFRVTTAVTIVFPERLKKHMNNTVDSSSTAPTDVPSQSLVAPEAVSSKPQISIVDDEDQQTCASVLPSTSSNHGLPFASSAYYSSMKPIPPRHSSWYEIPKIPPPVPMYVPTYEEILRFYEQTNSSSYLQSDDFQQATIELERLEKKAYEDGYSHRLIFDSFTAQSRSSSKSESINPNLDPPTHNTSSSSTPPLISHLLPNLSYCRIKHSEPNFEGCTFVFDRLSIPRHRFTDNEAEHESEYWRRKLDKEHLKMREIYGVQLDEHVKEIEGMSYCRFLENHRITLRSF